MGATAYSEQPWKSISSGRREESFADDLNKRRGILSGRVALLPRSTEIQPSVASIRIKFFLLLRVGFIVL